jgi:hypothetical protein
VLSGHPGPTQAVSLTVPEAAANSLFRNILPVSPSASIFCLQRGTFPSTNLNKIMDFPYIDEKILRLHMPPYSLPHFLPERDC